MAGALRGHGGDDARDAVCAECEAAPWVGPCAACESLICGDCGVFSRDPEGVRVICYSCARLIADVRERAPRRRRLGAIGWIAVVLVVAGLSGLVALLGCGGGAVSPQPSTAAPVDDHAAPALVEVEPTIALPPVPESRVAARVFAFGDSQLHYHGGKRTFAQSPVAEQRAFEVAVRPAALDDGADLLLGLFLDQRTRHWPAHVPVFLGDATDLSCTHELDAFEAVLRRHGVDRLLAVTSNHDGFFAGNFTSRRDLDGRLAVTDMPHDWTRACARPGSFADHRLTRGRATHRLRALLPDAPAWATSSAHADDPTAYRDAHLYFVRPLGGGDPGVRPAWGVFLDTADYRGFDLEGARGAGSHGAVSRAQLRFLDRAMFEARTQSGAWPADAPVGFLAFGHHPLDALEPDSRARLLAFLAARPEIVAYVAGHRHRADERLVRLADGRTIPELVVGSTTDAPQSARLLEVRVGAGRDLGLTTRRLDLAILDDTRAARMCDEVAPLASDTTGYTGYRVLRDGTPALDIDALDELAFAIGLDDLGRQRAVQGIGALLIENELVRAWAQLYAEAPLYLPAGDREALERILARRYAAGDSLGALAPYLRGVARIEASRYDAWHDPVVAPVLTVAEHAVHRFASHLPLVDRLRALRTSTPAAHRYFVCHAARAARAEARAPARRGDILYIH